MMIKFDGYKYKISIALIIALLTFTVFSQQTMQQVNAQGLFGGLSVNDTANAGSWSIQANLQVGNTEFGDRTFTFTSVPTLVKGAAWIRTANASKLYTGNPVATFTLGQPATIYLAVDTRIGKPSWFDSAWTDAGQSLSTSESTSRKLELWQKSYSAGQVSLGPINNNLTDFYSVIAVPTGGATLTPTFTPTFVPITITPITATPTNTPTNTPTPIPTGGNSLASSLLTLTLTTNPYSYKVTVNSTSVLLVSENSSAITIGGASHAIASASNLSKTATTLDADLALSGSTTVGHVKFTFTSARVLQVLLTTKSGTPTQINEAFDDHGEHYYGLFEYPWGGDKTAIDVRGLDQDYVGAHPTSPNWTNARAPYYMTSSGYALYVQSVQFGHFTVAVSNKTSFFFTDSHLQYNIMYGPDYPTMLASYTSIAGGSYMPPDWAFDTIWWRDDDHKNFPSGVTNAQQNVVNDAAQIQNNKLPSSGIWIDRPFGTGTQGWGNNDFDSSFPNPAQMVKDVNSHGLKLMLWIANRSWSPNTLYTQGNSNGYLVPGISQSTGPAWDMRKPGAVSLFSSDLAKYVNLGIQGWKIDRGEEGEQPDSMQNENMNIFEHMANQALAAKFGKDYFVFARDASDTARKDVVIWNGDVSGTFDNLRTSITTALRTGMINFPMWGSDTGGYTSAPTEELFARWFEFSDYSSMMEVLIGGSRTPWINFSSNLVTIARTQTTNHHDMIPYTRSLMYQATQNGMPIMRSLVLLYPTDSKVTNMSDEYLYGQILVAPITVAGATNRSVYLPAGKWMDYNNRTTILTGSQTITAAAPLDTIPTYVQEGAIIPRGDIVKDNNNWTPNWSPNLRIEFYPSNTISSHFDYYTGSGLQTITGSKQNGNYTIQFGDLGLPGKLNVYVGSFSSIVRNGTTLTQGTDYTYDASKKLLTVSFTGATTLIINGENSLF